MSASAPPLRSALDRLRALVEDEGPQPKYHRAVVVNVETLWPSLLPAVRAVLLADDRDRGCECEDYAPTCRHTEYPDATVCPDCGARRDCPVHGVDEDSYEDPRISAAEWERGR